MSSLNTAPFQTAWNDARTAPLGRFNCLGGDYGNLKGMPRSLQRTYPPHPAHGAPNGECHGNHILELQRARALALASSGEDLALVLQGTDRLLRVAPLREVLGLLLLAGGLRLLDRRLGRGNVLASLKSGQDDAGSGGTVVEQKKCRCML